MDAVYRWRCVQAVMQLRAELALGGAAALERQGFLDTAQEILSQFAAGTGASAAAATAEAKMRLFLAQVRVLPSPDTPTDLILIELSAELLSMHCQLPSKCATRPALNSPGCSLVCRCASVRIQWMKPLQRNGDCGEKNKVSGTFLIFGCKYCRLQQTLPAATIRRVWEMACASSGRSEALKVLQGEPSSRQTHNELWHPTAQRSFSSPSSTLIL